MIGLKIIKNERKVNFMNYDQFIKKYNGKKTDYDGAAGVQCVDLAKAYMKEVFNIPQFSIGGAARFYFERFENFKQLTANFEKIKNTPLFVPQKGDICVWGSSFGRGFGHVAIANGDGNTKYFYSYDQIIIMTAKDAICNITITRDSSAFCARKINRK